MKNFFLAVLAGSALVAATSAAADAIATVDGKQISSQMLDAMAKARMQKDSGTLTEEEKNRATDELIQLFVLSSAAEKAKLPKDPEIAIQLDLQRRSLLAQSIVQKHLEDNPVSDAELQAAYKESFGSQQTEYKARHILLESPNEAMDLIEQLDSGANFAALAEQHSTGPTANTGGDLGWFGAQQMVKPFSDAVAALDKGAYTPAPVQTQFGWHVILKEDQRDVAPPDMETVKAGLERQLLQQKIQQFLTDLRSKAKVTRN